MDPDSYQYAVALGLLGRALREQERFEAAREAVGSSLEAFERTVGPQHEYVATSLLDLGALRLHGADLEAAETSFRRRLRSTSTSTETAIPWWPRRSKTG